MAATFPLPVTAAQVGTYFVGQYYQMLQNQPKLVHQFYGKSSTMLRIDGSTRETATNMLQINQLVLSLNYTGIEIKSAHSLESWDCGVLVMVSGSVYVNNFNGKKKFVETFFLAPQTGGYFVLNDIFHYVDEVKNLQHPIGYLPQSNLDNKLHSAATVREKGRNYILGGDIQSKQFLASEKIEEDAPVNNYSYHEDQLQVPTTEKNLDEDFDLQANGVLHGNVHSEHDQFSSPNEESVAEPQKHTYASIVAKARSAQAISQSPINKPTTPEMQPTTETPAQPSIASSNQNERSGVEPAEEISAVEDEVEFKSVYVRNVPSTMAASEIGEEFKKFGKLRPDGVAIRTRKDIDVCYAFVEFEDSVGVHNAIKASMVEISGHPLYIEGRRPNRNNSVRARARGRGRVSYQMEGRGRPGGRVFSRVSNHDAYDRDYNRPKANEFYRKPLRQERAYVANHGSRNGPNSLE
ncbi:nuclear transport factor 2-like isoform X2 [Andrographis paniculata]|uniref:nuclear transport factor 2-like isoform X2 n=1 Tax=Andrographis paniculata TaxID=175694 RepID=UPI0021E9075D|nr:nuclear transport factor 2-like isoform X2 [Andrographis paniculata]